MCNVQCIAFDRGSNECACKAGYDIKLLYTSLEQVERSGLLRKRLLQLQRVVYDEAHCIKDMGETFRWIVMS